MVRDREPEALSEVTPYDKIAQARAVFFAALEELQNPDCDITEAFDQRQTATLQHRIELRRENLNLVAEHGGVRAESLEEFSAWLQLVTSVKFRLALAAHTPNSYLKTPEATLGSWGLPITPLQLASGAAYVAGQNPEVGEAVVQLVQQTVETVTPEDYGRQLAAAMAKSLDTRKGDFKLALIGGRFENTELSDLQVFSLAYLGEIDYGELPKNTNKLLQLLKNVSVSPENTYLFRANAQLLAKYEEKSGIRTPYSANYFDAATTATHHLLSYLAKITGEGGNATKILALFERFSEARGPLSYRPLLVAGKELTAAANQILLKKKRDPLEPISPDIANLPQIISRTILVAMSDLSPADAEGAPGQLTEAVHAAVNQASQAGVARHQQGE